MYCARCRKQLSRGETTGESALYFPNSKKGFTLCEPCFFSEDKEIEEKGTNDIPDTLAKYYRDK